MCACSHITSTNVACTHGVIRRQDEFQQAWHDTIRMGKASLEQKDDEEVVRVGRIVLTQLIAMAEVAYKTTYKEGK